jgi:hypothetical protein
MKFDLIEHDENGKDENLIRVSTCTRANVSMHSH